MQAIILAAGEGIRMRPLTNDRPKPMVELCGKPILEHIVEKLPDQIDELVIVVGYKGEFIIEHCGKELLGRPVKYVFQEKKEGTAKALISCRQKIKDRFLLLYADDLHEKDGLEKLLRHDNSILAAQHDEAHRFGVITLNTDGTVERILEKPKKPPTDLVCAGPAVLSLDIFSYEADRHSNGEYVLTSMIEKMAKDKKVYVERSTFWFPLATCQDVERAALVLDRSGKNKDSIVR